MTRLIAGVKRTRKSDAGRSSTVRRVLTLLAGSSVALAWYDLELQSSAGCLSVLTFDDI